MGRTEAKKLVSKAVKKWPSNLIRRVKSVKRNCDGPSALMTIGDKSLGQVEGTFDECMGTVRTALLLRDLDKDLTL